MLYRCLMALSLVTLPMHSYAMPAGKENAENKSSYTNRQLSTRKPFSQKKQRQSLPVKRSAYSDLSPKQETIPLKKHRSDLVDEGSESDPSLASVESPFLESFESPQSSLPLLDLDDLEVSIESTTSLFPLSSLSTELPKPAPFVLSLSDDSSVDYFSSDDFSPSYATPPSSPVKPVLVTPQSKFWSPVKSDFALTPVEDLTSPFVRKKLSRKKFLEFFREQTFMEKTVFYQDSLFDPRALVIGSDGKWESNLERMKQGRCPVGHKGIVEKENAEGMSVSEVRRRQRYHRIELQHVTQKDTNTEDDPICEMTHAVHMSRETNFVLKLDPETGTYKIIKKHLTVDAAKELAAQHRDYFVRTNILHFREGASLIDRPEFRSWREKYWKHRAEQLKPQSLQLF